MNYSFELYKFDLDCFRCSVYLSIFFICLFIVSQIFIHSFDSILGILVFIVEMLVFIICMIRIYKFHYKLKTQMFRKIVVDEDSNITLYGYNDNIVHIGRQNVLSNKITKITLIIFPFRSHTSCELEFIFKLGNIEITTISGEKYNIIISDIENFIKNTIYKNVIGFTAY